MAAVKAVKGLEAAGQPCKYCRLLHDKPDMVLCEKCNTAVHATHAENNRDTVIYAGPWVCNSCCCEMLIGPCEDILWSFGVVDFLFLGMLP